jgi:hypothetical protein
MAWWLESFVRRSEAVCRLRLRPSQDSGSRRPSTAPRRLAAQNSLVHAMATADLSVTRRVRGNETQHTQVPANTKTLAEVERRC